MAWLCAFQDFRIASITNDKYIDIPIVVKYYVGRKKALLFAIVLFGVSLSIAAQTPMNDTGTINGILVDSYGATMPQARIAAVRLDAATGEKSRKAITSTKGEFKFVGLPFWTYKLEFALSRRN